MSEGVLRSLARRCVAVDLVEFVVDALHVVGVAQQFDQGPCGGALCGVVTREHHRNKHPGDGVGVEAHLDEHVHEVAIILVLIGAVIAARNALVHDALDEVDELRPRGVALAEALDVGVHVDVGDRVGALLEVVEQLRDPLVELFTELAADQTRRRGVERQFTEELQQIDLAFVTPPGDDAFDLVGNRHRVLLHVRALERRVVDRFGSLLRTRVEDDSLTENRCHEGICRRLVEVLLGCAEEVLVGRGT
ncbi:Uncharacterised protein [Mycobacteroides abscessus subsp. abscessus]|nr:Uncharacterised protein [Mycobacteroides abscessus subsp. abscessus]